jgi:hypothetical protein
MRHHALGEGGLTVWVGLGCVSVLRHRRLDEVGFGQVCMYACVRIRVRSPVERRGETGNEKCGRVGILYQNERKRICERK